MLTMEEVDQIISSKAHQSIQVDMAPLGQLLNTLYAITQSYIIVHITECNSPKFFGTYRECQDWLIANT